MLKRFPSSEPELQVELLEKQTDGTYVVHARTGYCHIKLRRRMKWSTPTQYRLGDEEVLVDAEEAGGTDEGDWVRVRRERMTEGEKRRLAAVERLAKRYHVKACAEFLAMGIALTSWHCLDSAGHSLEVVGFQAAMAVGLELATDIACICILRRCYKVDVRDQRGPLTYAYSWAVAVPLCLFQMSMFVLVRYFDFLEPVAKLVHFDAMQ